MKLQFANLWILLFLWTLPLIGFWWYSAARQREKKMALFVSRAMQNKLRPAFAFHRFAWQSGLIIAGLALCIIAAARPQWGTKEQTIYQRGRDIVIAIDVSRSMLAEDVHPNRLNRAKTDIRDLIKELRGDRAAIVAFRYKARLICPLTTDYAYINHALDGVDIDSAPRGETDIGDAITQAMEAFEDESSSHKAIVLISDGEDLSGRALKMAKQAGEKNIPIFAIGLGNPAGAPIPEHNAPGSFVKYQGKDVSTKLDNSTLYEIAKLSGGAYIAAQTAAMDLGNLYSNKLKNVSEKDMKETLKRLHVERYQIFLLPALLLFIAAGCLSLGRLGTGSTNKEAKETTTATPPPVPPLPLKQILLILSFSILTFTAAAQNTSANGTDSTTVPKTDQAATESEIDLESKALTPSGRDGARVAQKHYSRGEYEKAAEIYLQAARESTAQSQRDFKHNAATAYFNAGKYKEAADLLRQMDLASTVSDPSISSALGASIYRQAKDLQKENSEETKSIADLLKESGEFFRDSARAEYANEESLKNLAVVLKELPEAQQRALISGLLKKYEKKSAPELTAEMLKNQREIEEAMKKAFKNNDPSQIEQLEKLAKQQKENSELWIPLKRKLIQSMSQQGQGQNMQQIAAMEENIEYLRDQMKNASKKLRNLDNSSQDSVYSSRMAIYKMWKSIADYSGVLKEDIRLQSNIIQKTSAKLPDPGTLIAAQTEARSLTETFLDRFKQAVPEGGSPTPPAPQAAPASNPSSTISATTASPKEQEGGISAKDRAKILELAAQAISSQESTIKKINSGGLTASVSDQKKSYEILKEIEKLLPKSKQQNQDQKQDKQDQDQQQNKQNQQPDKPKQDKDKPKQDKQADEPKPDKESEDVKALLEKALQREKDHEAEKRRRNRSIPLSPRDRDW